MNNEYEIVYISQNNNLVVFNESVIAKLLKYKQVRNNTPESGGVLIGERRGEHIVICDISEPNSNDYQTRYSVNRKGTHHQDKVNSTFLRSNGYLQYIGEWHTHPEDFPFPSSQDKKSWSQGITNKQTMIVVIIGRLDLWVGKKGAFSIEQLQRLGK